MNMKDFQLLFLKKLQRKLDLIFLKLENIKFKIQQISHIKIGKINVSN